MEPPQKRLRVNHDDERPDLLRTLSRPISPPVKNQSLHPRALKSPWQLTWIRDLPESLNQDAVTLNDLVGDPLICECWEFNFLHDISFLMAAFDPDTRHLVQVHIVHGFWKQEDANRTALSIQAAEHENVKLHVAPMPEMFGTHHSKMMVLFRHDDTAEIIIHTANMIAKDWTNMTNAVWKSPRLCKSKAATARQDYTKLLMGSGERFKWDLLKYFEAYDRRQRTCRPLADKLRLYDFSAIRAALIASVPGHHKVHDVSTTSFGWSGLRNCLKAVPCEKGNAEIVAQMSSIATLGPKNTWLEKTLFDSLAVTATKNMQRPKFKLVFPTADEIRGSLDGYTSGASIHTKTQSAQQAQQLIYLRPILHHWAQGCENGAALPSGAVTRDGGRERAAPHIKTYIRFNEGGSVDWALLTSANLSKQAWGEAVKPTGDMRIASWEVGVLVWPDLYGEETRMIGTFQTDVPEGTGRLVGLRVPYSMPLQRYGAREVPWVATLSHDELDCHGQRWPE